jgi:hypothetical protein
MVCGSVVEAHLNPSAKPDVDVAISAPPAIAKSRVVFMFEPSCKFDGQGEGIRGEVKGSSTPAAKVVNDPMRISCCGQNKFALPLIQKTTTFSHPETKASATRSCSTFWKG